MTLPIILLLVSLVVIVVVQTLHRLWGAVLLFVWCAVALAYGLNAFERGVDLKMLGIQAKPWNFIAFMAVMMAYNLIVVVRVLRKPAPKAAAAPAPDVVLEEQERNR